ncbi:MAG: hypothetical protein KF830_00020 [Planctomycetes bacterium]|nr:hypothetical protein [Planctomycetota bacterium]
MTRLPVLLSSAALLAAAAHAQCYSVPATGPVTLVQWSSGSGYTSTFPADDEGITNPPIDLTPAFGAGGFPMAGAVGVLDQMWINSNGEVYLTDSSLALTQPVNGASFGVNLLDEARGTLAGASPRIFPLGADHEASVALGAVWSVTCDVSPGQVKVSWTDMARFANTTDRFSFACTLFATGAVEFEYGPTFPAPASFTGRWVGVSIGNMVGSTSSPSRDLTAPCLLNDTGTEGLIYQSFTAAGSWDLTGKTLLIVPNGIGGYCSTVTCEPASHTAYGTGCYAIPAQVRSSLAQTWASGAAAKAALDGNALQFTISGSAYVATWLPGVAGALYVPPVAATIIANGDDTTSTITPSAAAPIPGGSAPQWTVSSNGILTAAATGNNGTSFSPSLASMAGGAAPNLGFYVWRDWNPAEAGSGKIKWEEIGGVVYITWDDVEAYGTPSPNRATFQWQIDLATGNVTVVWVSMEGSTSASTTLVGCTLAGVGLTPPSVSLAGVSPFLMGTDVAAVNPMALSAAPAPVINPSTVVTYTATNLTEFIPTSGVYLSTMFLSVNPFLAGLDLGIIGAPGCNAHIFTLDLDLGGQVTFAPSASWNFTYDNVGFAPGNIIAAQAICLFDPAFPLPNGQNAFGLLTSNAVLSLTETF